MADNRVAELDLAWDEAPLRDLHAAGVDLSPFWTDAEFAALVAEPLTGRTAENAVVAPGPTDMVRGDLVALGRHRLLCGDATVADEVARVLAGVVPALMVTDPPYGVQYTPAWRHDAYPEQRTAVGTVTNDDRADWTAAWRLFPGNVAYVWHAGLHAATVASNLETAGFELRAQVIWVKQHFALSRGHYHWRHEPCWYAVRRGATAQWCGDRRQSTVWEVPTGPPTVNDVAVTSTPASGTTYYLAGEVIEFTVTFSAPVTVTATPKFAFRLGAATRQAAYASGSDSVALVFARTVQAGEVDRNGISWNALALALDGGTITQTGATTAARLTHAAQAPLAGHRVDAAPPMQVSASVQGLSLVLVYDEPLDPASMPATGAYTVTATVGATTTNPAVSEVSIYGIWVTLTLDAAPAAGATVTLAYAPPASNPVQDEAGNDAPAFSGQSVRLGQPPPDLAQVMGVGVAPGNAQLVVTWTAVDTRPVESRDGRPANVPAGVVSLLPRVPPPHPAAECLVVVMGALESRD